MDYLFSMTSWNEDMEALIEQAYSVNQLPVHVVTHSMGGKQKTWEEREEKKRERSKRREVK